MVAGRGSATICILKGSTHEVPRQALILESRHLAPQDGDRSLRHSENGLRSGRHGSCDRWVIRVRVTVGAVVNPDILLASESHEGDRAGEHCTRLALRVLKLYAHGVRVGL